MAKETATKSLHQVGDLADILSWATYLQESTAWEREQEGDGSPIPDKLKSWMADGVNILVDLAREEGSEAVTAMKTQIETAVTVAKAKNPAAKCGKALETMGGCLQKACKCKGLGACGEKMAAAHADATQALNDYVSGIDLAKATKAKDPIAKCTKALASVGECLGNKCKCQDAGKCLAKVCAAHEDATDALGQLRPMMAVLKSLQLKRLQRWRLSQPHHRAKARKRK